MKATVYFLKKTTVIVTLLHITVILFIDIYFSSFIVWTFISMNITLTVKNEWEGAIIEYFSHVITGVFCFVPSNIQRGNSSPRATCTRGGEFTTQDPSLLHCHWSPWKLHQFKTRHHFLPSLHTAQPLKRQIGRDRQAELVRLCVCTRVGQTVRDN